MTVLPASTSGLAYSAAAPWGSARNHTSTSIFACSCGSDGRNLKLASSRWRNDGIFSATGVPARLREVTHESSAIGWRAKILTSSIPAYPDAPVIPAFIFLSIIKNLILAFAAPISTQ